MGTRPTPGAGRRAQNLKNKKILITAGPTWVNIDGVRVISNIASGQTGMLLAQQARNQGARVSLLLGPADVCCPDKSIRILRFKFFDELKDRMVKELKAKRYDIVIHSAAVSDYRPARTFKKKISSGTGQLNLKLVPTEKIVSLIKKADKSVLAAAFKFEPQAAPSILIRRAKRLLKLCRLDLVVANNILNGRYRAYILSKDRTISGPLISKKGLARELIKKISEHI